VCVDDAAASLVESEDLATLGILERNNALKASHSNPISIPLNDPGEDDVLNDALNSGSQPTVLARHDEALFLVGVGGPRQSFQAALLLPEGIETSLISLMLPRQIIVDASRSIIEPIEVLDRMRDLLVLNLVAQLP
jgi:hypothetical protein